MTSFLQVRSWGDERVSIWNWSRSKFLIGKISVLAKALRIQMFIYNQLFGAEELKVDLLSIGRANVNKKWFSRHHLNSPAVQMTIRQGNMKHSSFLFIASPRLERLCFVNLILITIEKALLAAALIFQKEMMQNICVLLFFLATARDADITVTLTYWPHIRSLDL